MPPRSFGSVDIWPKASASASVTSWRSVAASAGLSRPRSVTYPNVRKCRICWWESMTELLVGSAGQGHGRAGQEEPGRISLRRGRDECAAHVGKAARDPDDASRRREGHARGAPDAGRHVRPALARGGGGDRK